MKKYIFSFIVLGVAIIALAETSGPNIQYPVKELGNCSDEESCRTYCDEPGNINACINFAEKNNLMTEKEIKQAKNFIAAGANGPGGCTGKESCEKYCNDISHIDECISFAEKNNLIPQEELEEARKVQAAIKRGVKPPSCGSKARCDAYCAEPDHMEECVTFGIEAGFIQGKELEDVQKMLAAVKRGVKPPPCKGKRACDEYCGNPDNMEICMNFAMEAGFMSEEEKQNSQKMLQAIKRGVKPPACRGKEECDIYCAEESHFEECMKFAEEAGFMSPEEAEMARKTGGKGPGGCKGKEECEAFCNNPDNQETCFNFAEEHGLIPEEDLKRMEEGKRQFQETMQNMPSEVYACLESIVGVETMAKFKSGAATPPKEIGDQMRVCFEQNMPQKQEGRPGEGGMMPPEGFTPETTGPGGCASPEECRGYCESNQEACQNFQPPQSGQPPMPCEGENCPQSGYAPDIGPMMPCEGPDCSRFFSPPPPSGEEGTMMPAGEIQPENSVPPMPSVEPMPFMEQSPSVPPPSEPPPSSSASVPSLAGIIFWPLIKLLEL